MEHKSEIEGKCEEASIGTMEKENEAVEQQHGDEAYSAREISPAYVQVTVDASADDLPQKRPNLRLQIPPRSLDPSELSGGKPPQSPSSAKSLKAFTRALLPRPSFRSRVSTPPAPSPSTSFKSQQIGQGNENQTSPSSFSLARVFNPISAGRTSSLPVTPVADAVISISDEDQGAAPMHERISEKLLAKPKFERSLSAPLKKTKSLKRMPSLAGSVMLVKSATPRLSEQQNTAAVKSTKDTTAASPRGEEDHGEEIPAEQAVCRICMDELGEGGKTLQMECNCKGELALAHEDCALKWFGIKGNHTCDVCGKEVENLPVMLMRLPNDNNGSRQQAQLSRLDGMQGIWQDVPVLIMISMLAYFCLLEQLLVRDMGSGALAIALPFACILGLLASITASTLVTRKFIWGYAALQFTLVILFAHIFYNVVHVEAVLSILLSAFAGFGIAMSLNGICLEYASWQRSQSAQVAQVGTSGLHDVELAQHGTENPQQVVSSERR